MDSFMGRIGGKKRLRDAIISRFPQEMPARYIEVFGGAGWVLFRKEKHLGQLEVFNDLDKQVVNLFRCIKYHREALQKELDWLPSSRTIFNDLLQMINLNGLTDIQRAARYLYLAKISFGADHKTFATSKKGLARTLNFMEEVQHRLEGVVIECKGYENLISVYDRQNALFYLDPPYVGSENLYDCLFDVHDHLRLCDILKHLKGSFILSYNDCELVRDLYSNFKCERIERQNMLPSVGNNRTPFQEVIIRNY